MMAYRSARTGRFVSRATAARYPRTSLRERRSSGRGHSPVYRSAISGRFISKAAAKRHPNTSVRETS